MEMDIKITAAGGEVVIEQQLDGQALQVIRIPRNNAWQIGSWLDLFGKPQLFAGRVSTSFDFGGGETLLACAQD